MPGKSRPARAERVALDRRQPGTCLDEDEIRPGGETRCDAAQGTDHVLHQRAASRADLGDGQGQGSADGRPGLDQPDGNQFAEHLADLGRRDEVARRAEGLACGVVAMFGIEQADRHVVGDRDRTGSADERGDLLAQAVHAAADCATCDLARQMAHRPKSTMGVESIMPMVSQPPAR